MSHASSAWPYPGWLDSHTQAGAGLGAQALFTRQNTIDQAAACVWLSGGCTCSIGIATSTGKSRKKAVLYFGWQVAPQP